MTEDPARKALNAIVEALQPLSSADRKRAVLGALHFLEEDWVPLPQRNGSDPPGTTKHKPETNDAFPPAVQVWMEKNELTADEIEQVFAFEEGKVNIIADLPGKGKRENAIAIYTLMGLGTYLHTGERKFADDLAREACALHNAYDTPNHSKTMKELKSELTGDKAAGWTITSPGLKRAATIVKQLATGPK